jgi:hypothetical protein
MQDLIRVQILQPQAQLSKVLPCLVYREWRTCWLHSEPHVHEHTARHVLEDEEEGVC